MESDLGTSKPRRLSSESCRSKVDQLHTELSSEGKKCNEKTSDIDASRPQRKGTSDERNSKRLRRAFSVQQENPPEEATKPPKQVSPSTKPKTPPQPQKTTSFVKFGPATLPAPNHPETGFFKQRASFHSDTASSASAASASTSSSSLGQQDEGIICSNSDLRSILSDAQGNRKKSIDIKRERMKNHRSLSFDSSMFRLPRRNDSPIWLNKQSTPHGSQSPKERREESQNVIQIRVTSDESGEDNKDSMLLIASVPNKSDVTWDEKSVVDATILGSAIESYLGEKKGTSSSTEQLDQQEASLCSSLRSLFVK